ncbi:zinc finger protein 665-like [Mustela nigripes]|uniref:zinc finger protein 665-like n=1 Tax=Mustela nigripes TaxID=77151 RepID=UPI002815E0B9|nr:zinc finger protein 665-like [Mustela nigripes]
MPRVRQALQQTLVPARAPAGPHGRRPHTYRACGKAFHEKSGLAHHHRTHTGERPVGAPRAPRGGTEPDAGGAAEAHGREAIPVPAVRRALHQVIRAHPAREIPPRREALTLRLRGKAFSQNMQLAEHPRSHPGDRPAQCSACGRSYSQRPTWPSSSAHIGERPFPGQECGKVFSQKAPLSTTYRSTPARSRTAGPVRAQLPEGVIPVPATAIHSDKRPFQCGVWASPPRSARQGPHRQEALSVRAVGQGLRPPAHADRAPGIPHLGEPCESCPRGRPSGA